MNFLAHLFLSGDEPELLLGNLMGDFVKGRLDGRYPPGIERGITLHRRIDSFAATSPSFLRSKRRLNPSFGHFRGVLVDLYYDHFLAVDWDDYADRTYSRFVSDAYRIALDNELLLPAGLRRIVAMLFTEWLPSYREVAGIERALTRMGGRVTRPNPLGEGGRELRRCYDELHTDFQEFFPELMVLAGMREV